MDRAYRGRPRLGGGATRFAQSIRTSPPRSVAVSRETLRTGIADRCARLGLTQPHLMGAELDDLREAATNGVGLLDPGRLYVAAAPGKVAPRARCRAVITSLDRVGARGGRAG